MQYRSALTNTAAAGVDPLFAGQWNLSNVGQAGASVGEDLNLRGAWTSNKGSGVRVAVVDNGLETVHSDLAGNVVARASFSYRPEQAGGFDPLPCYSGDTHGTSVAGLVAAVSENGIGGSGVAPQAKLVGYNALATNTDADLADALTRDLANNAVYNSSWGSADDATLHSVSQLHDQALEHGLRQGRAGRGALYVFAAGNGGCVKATGDAQTCQQDNSNFDGYLTHMGAIVVGSVDRHGRAPSYAEPGANLLVSAPGGDSGSGVTTTAVRNGFTQGFAGTSAATPQVSGVIALMLAANPTLSWRDVRIILAQTARKNDPADASWKSGVPVVSATTSSTLAPSSTTPSYSHRFGFGVVDATAAVNQARSWASVGGSDQLKTCGPFNLSVDVAIPDGQPALTSAQKIDASQCGLSQIEHVTVTADIEHEYSGDLAITLTSPSGQDSELSAPRRCGNTGRDIDRCGRFNDWRFSSVRHLGENPLGNWLLTVRDQEAGKTGKLNRWSITVYGR